MELKTFDGKTFWLNHAPNFNFEYDKDDLIKLGLEREFIVQVGDDEYAYKDEYIQKRH